MSVASSSNDTPRPGGRWFRFSLRTLFVLMTIAAIWLGLTMKRLHEQERAVARLQKLGGKVAYDYQIDANFSNTIPNAKPPGPNWVRRFLGPQWNVRVIVATLSDDSHQATDEKLELVSGFRDLRRLNSGSGSKTITDNGLRHVGRLHRLELLWLDHCTGVTDEGLAHLSDLHRLTVLFLNDCKIDGSGLRDLNQLPIGWLELAQTPIIDDNLATLAPMNSIVILDLQGTLLTDRGLLHLRGLSNLRELNLSGTAVSDEGLVQLASLPNLIKLDVSASKVTSQGVAKLKQALPNLKVIGSPKPPR